jgi:hypothetical protein
MQTMTRAQRIAMIQREMRHAKAECKMGLYMQLLEELAIVLRA